MCRKDADQADASLTRVQQQQPAGQLSPPAIRHGNSNYSQNTQDSDYSQQQPGATTTTAAAPGASSGYGAAAGSGTYGGQPPLQQGSATLSQADFLSRVEAAKADIRTLTTQVSSIAAAHQRTLSSTDSSASAALESITTDTQVLNTRIKDQIKFLETDAARSGGNSMKDSQVGQLKTSFKKQLEEFRNEEASYERRYREQIARQYRIVNPDATEQEVQEASNADWGNEGVFQTAVSLIYPQTPPFYKKSARGSLHTRRNQLTQAQPAQNKPNSNSKHRPGLRPRPSQRHPTHRTHPPRTQQTIPRPGRSGHRARTTRPTSRAADRSRQEGYRGGQRAVGQGHCVGQARAAHEVVVVLDLCSYRLYPCPGAGYLFWSDAEE